MKKEDSKSGRKIKSVEELTFADGFMFSWLMRNPEICRGILAPILGFKIGRIEYPALEKSIAEFYESKGVRLDVYTADQRCVYDIEIQCELYSALPLRSRYYQSMIDCDNLLKGQKYDRLKESFIIFVCKEDMFGAGLPRYTFRNVCRENGRTELGDKATKIFLNAAAFDTEKRLALRAILEYIKSNKATDEFTRRLEYLVAETKMNNKFRSDYMIATIHEQDYLIIGEREGRAAQKAEDQKIIDAQAAVISNKDAEIAALKEQLAAYSKSAESAKK